MENCLRIISEILMGLEICYKEQGGQHDIFWCHTQKELFHLSLGNYVDGYKVFSLFGIELTIIGLFIYYANTKKFR